MRKIEIDTNEGKQRIDRFLKKYLKEASKGFIYKMLRKKRIKVNGNKAAPDYILETGDIIEFYLSEETINKFQKEQKKIFKKAIIEVVYEDENILLVNKPIGLLVHEDNKEKENTLINQVYYYLNEKGSYFPEKENTFSPACCNRLDRNTSGIIIIAKNFPTLQAVNKILKENKIEKKYIALVKGHKKEYKELKGYWIKDTGSNKVKIVHQDIKGSKFIHTKYKGLKQTNNYTLLEIQLITGRSHQIRAHLSSEGIPIVGDHKYGDIPVNRELHNKYGLKSQFLHAYSLKFYNCPELLKNLEDRTFKAELPSMFNKILQDIF